jgi:hypothetical protein
MDSNIEQVRTVVGVFGAARLRPLPRSAQQGSEPSLFASVVGLRGYKLNPAVQRYLAAGPQLHRPRHRPDTRPQHRITMRLPAKTIRKIVEDYSDGATAALVAKRYGIAKSTVLGLIRGAGAEVRRPRLDNDDITLIVALHREGLQQSEIAARVGCSPSAVWHALRRISAI